MTPRPVSLGLFLCDQAIVEEGTKKVSLIGSFNQLTADRFPFSPQPFVVFSALTDGQGRGKLQLVVTLLDTDEVIYRRESQVQMPDRLAVVRVRWRVSEFVFPRSGLYQFSLQVDGEWIAHNRLQVGSCDGNITMNEPFDPKTYVGTHSMGCIDIHDESKGDTTVRPRPPNVPRFWPPDTPLPGGEPPFQSDRSGESDDS